MSERIPAKSKGQSQIRWRHHSRWRSIWQVVGGGILPHKTKKTPKRLFCTIARLESSHCVNRFFDRREDFVDLLFADNEWRREGHAVTGKACQNP